MRRYNGCYIDSTHLKTDKSQPAVDEEDEEADGRDDGDGDDHDDAGPGHHEGRHALAPIRPVEHVAYK